MSDPNELAKALRAGNEGQRTPEPPTCEHPRSCFVRNWPLLDAVTTDNPQRDYPDDEYCLVCAENNEVTGDWLNMIARVAGSIPCGGTSLEIAERHLKSLLGVPPASAAADTPTHAADCNSTLFNGPMGNCSCGAQPTADEPSTPYTPVGEELAAKSKPELIGIIGWAYESEEFFRNKSNELAAELSRIRELHAVETERWIAHTNDLLNDKRALREQHDIWKERAEVAEAALDTSQDQLANYEKNYVIPCFTWAKEIGFDLQKAVLDNAGHNCVELLVKHLREQRDAAECKLKVKESKLESAIIALGAIACTDEGSFGKHARKVLDEICGGAAKLDSEGGRG